MTWIFIEAAEAFPEWSETFDRLNDKLFQGHPLLSSMFAGPLVRHFGRAGDLLAVHSSDEGCDACVLLRKRGPGIWQTFLPAQAQIPPVLLSSSASIGSLLRALPGFNLAIEWLCQDEHCSALVPALSDSDLDCDIHATTMSISLEGSFDQYWFERSKKLRQNIGRYYRRLEKDGLEFRMVTIDSPGALVAALDRYGDLESAGWKGKAKTAIHRSNAQGRFYADVLERFSVIGGARIYELYYGDALVASRVCVSKGGLLVMMKTTYRESDARYSPGRLLLHQLLEREFAREDFHTIEFYTNATKDQISWSTDTRPIQHVTQYRSAVLKTVAQRSRAIRKKLRI